MEKSKLILLNHNFNYLKRSSFLKRLRENIITIVIFIKAFLKNRLFFLSGNLYFVIPEGGAQKFYNDGRYYKMLVKKIYIQRFRLVKSKRIYKMNNVDSFCDLLLFYDFSYGGISNINDISYPIIKNTLIYRTPICENRFYKMFLRLSVNKNSPFYVKILR